MKVRAAMHFVAIVALLASCSDSEVVSETTIATEAPAESVTTVADEEQDENEGTDAVATTVAPEITTTTESTTTTTVP
ncbi:MAG: hypothetical protein ACKOBR_08990, partial [Actinomycetota bacterium]